MAKARICLHPEHQQLLDEVQVVQAGPKDIARLQSLLRRHHYLGMTRPVGERLFFLAKDKQGQWVGVLVFCAAAKYYVKHGKPKRLFVRELCRNGRRAALGESGRCVRWPSGSKRCRSFEAGWSLIPSGRS
jgi:hypothetical protein